MSARQRINAKILKMKTRNWTLLRATVKCLKVILSELYYEYNYYYEHNVGKEMMVSSLIQRNLDDFEYLKYVCKYLRSTPNMNRVRKFFIDPKNKNEQVLKEAWHQVEASSDVWRKLIIAIIMNS